MGLFDQQERAALRQAEPLPARMRPLTLDEFVGQEQILGEGKLLRRLIESDRLSSAIFYGPPGTGKTALAGVIARRTNAAFESLHAASAGVRDVRAVGERARRRLAAEGRRTVLFLDEIHRFNRGQQDALLRDVEEGVIILIGATTENPFFAVNGPLVSRSTIFRFEPLTPEHIVSLCRRALADARRGLAGLGVRCDDAALRAVAELAEGDARRALAALELAALNALARAGAPAAPSDAMPDAPAARVEPQSAVITAQDVADAMQRKALPFDRAGDAHYDLASAFIKSMRGGDADATVYWLARMLESGEDPLFIARRIAICASEDVGNADPRALLVAAAALQVTHLVGLPECELTLAQAAIYLACAPKSNAVTRAIHQARHDVRTRAALPVPTHLRDASYPGAAQLGHGVGYVYPHDHPDGVVDQDYLGARRAYYDPTQRGEERRMAEHVAAFRRLRARPTAAAGPDRHEAPGDGDLPSADPAHFAGEP